MDQQEIGEEMSWKGGKESETKEHIPAVWGRGPCPYGGGGGGWCLPLSAGGKP